MRQFALVGIDGEVFGVANTHEEVVTHIQNDPLGAMFCLEDSIVEFDLNDSPITSVGEEYRDKIEQYFVDNGLRNFHMNKQVGFYELSIDDRYKLIYETLTEPGIPFSFNDSRWKENTTKVDSIDEWGLDKTLEVTPVT